ncbi:MAG: hypothetical protein K2X55_29415, partial [Burkholderiaceae bacterium]|nr:hypothetical protein [Burkholderiaceae bacterium]
TIKASSLDRQFSKSRLEARLGAFVPGQNDEPAPDAKRQYQRKAMRSDVDTSELYARYLAQQSNVAQLRAAALNDASEGQRRQIGEVKAKGRLKRAVVNALSCDRWSKRLLYAAIGRTLLADIHQINQAHFAERQRIYQQHRRQTWADWLQTQAAHGNADALAALRGRKGRDGMRGNTLSGQRAAGKGRDVDFDSITKHGTVIICAGTTVVRDDGDKLAVTKGFDQQGLQVALSMAVERYGACIRVEGTAAFREQIVRAAASGGLNITFDDASLERRRRELLQINAEKESKHDFTNTGQGRSAGSGDGGNRGAATKSEAPVSTGCGKPNVGAVGKQPPPASQNRLRTMRQLGMVRIPGGSAVLLPGDVPGHLEQQGPAANHGMRRDVSGTGLSGARASKRAPRRRPGQREPLLSKLAGLLMPAPGKARFAKRQSAPPANQRARQLLDLSGLSMSAPGKARRAKRQSRPPTHQQARQLSDLAKLSMSGRGAVCINQNSRARGKPQESVPGGQASPKVKGSDAVQRYVFERQQTSRTFFGIPKHLAYDGFQGPATFGGLRKVGGEQLALLQRGDEIFVLAIDEPTAQRLKHLARGATLTVGRQGVIKKKGRSR